MHQSQRKMESHAVSTVTACTTSQKWPLFYMNYAAIINDFVKWGQINIIWVSPPGLHTDTDTHTHIIIIILTFELLNLDKYS